MRCNNKERRNLNMSQSKQNNSDRFFEINPETGEVIEMVNLVVPIGTIYKTPEQQRAIQKWKVYQEQLAKKKSIQNAIKNELGNFYFILTDSVFADVQPQTATKLIMLCSYLNYNNQFMINQKQPMTKNDIQQVLGLSKSAAYQFIQEVSGKYIEIHNDQLFVPEISPIFRHSIPKSQHFTQYQKCYIDTVRKLYKNTEVRKHKLLGYIFKLLPYINLEFNIFCQNPFETELKEIEPLSVSDFCNLVHYDVTQFSRLIKCLKSITFEHNGENEYIISYIDNGDDTPQSKRIFINPHIIYNGSNYHRVEVLGEFCRPFTRHSAESKK